MDLFDADAAGPRPPGPHAPLAERMRPTSLDEFAGQEKLLGEGSFLAHAVASGEPVSLILWGPPGSGKTTLARIIARASGAEFVEYSAVLSGVKEIRAVVDRAAARKSLGRKTLLFIDEIHRFNKAQQDAFLHAVEDGTITLIGATTENPSFEVNAPLLSRCRVMVLEPLSPGAIIKILERAMLDTENGLGDEKAELEEGVMEFMAEASHGDARAALGALETAYMMAAPDTSGVRRISMELASEAVQKKALLYDRGGEEHYNVISAFIKSMRASDPDAALYWLARMVEAGEDPLFIARRMVIFASEDIGNADPRALSVAVGVKDAVHFVGMPEGWIPLAQSATYLATAPKSNSSYAAYKLALADVKRHGPLPVPMHMRNAPTPLMKELGYGKGYKYPHDYPEDEPGEPCLPEGLKGRTYYRPGARGYEKEIAELMRKRGGRKD